MTVFKSIHDAVAAAVKDAVKSGALTLTQGMPAFTVEPPREAAHGDVAVNVAMLLTKLAGKPPRAIAEILKPKLEANSLVASVEIAGPGFINLRLKPQVWQDEIREILKTGLHYGDSNLGNRLKVNVEYVSANPTGPMHAGHVRGAVLGDTLSNLMEKTGYDVTREYYFNDAGAQVDVLARTVYLRYREALGENIGAIPEGFYPGEYLRDVAVALVQRDGKKWLGRDEGEWLVPVRNFAVDYMMRMIREDLVLIGITHSVFTNERDLIENGTLDKAFKILEGKNLIYVGTLPPPKGKEMENWEPVPLTLFRCSQFGASTDRPLKKRDGTWAYIMPDIAYHYDMIRRGFTLMINILGTDHGTYLEYMRPAIAAFSDGKAHLDVIFNNIVKVFKNGEPVKLSKRSGNLITLREMVEQVGPGAVRFFMLTRDPKSPLDFDFAKVVEQTRDNPVFYVQYAHARCSSILRHAAEIFTPDELKPESLMQADIGAILSVDELALVKLMASWPRVVEAAALAREPHRIAFYLMELAAAFHGLWNKGNDNAALRFIVPDDKNLTRARCALIKSVQIVIRNGFAVMGCVPVEEMRHESQPPELFTQRPIRSDFGRAPSYKARRIVTIVVILLLLGGIYHWVFGGPSLLHPGEIPTIKAEGAWKQRPDQPGGLDIPHQDVQVYQALDGKDTGKPEVEHLLPPPEVPQQAAQSPASNAANNTPPAAVSAAPLKTENLVTWKIETTDSVLAPQPPPAVATTVEAQPVNPPAPAPAPAAVETVKPAAAPPPVAQSVKKKPVTAAQTYKETAAAGTGDCVVQLASVQGEEPAQDMMSKLQAKYASILGDTELRVVRADLGAKGVFYRIQSQPMPDEQANNICSAVKKLKAGCILVR